ncbi:MAG: heparan-alpha-glucosaminide N-acetyltransferase domain-containing protein [Candidatus ainarchaeum sp.]|nr:heparan-alpha-glucosaminide N-acetyltransferase domain-containing protein [Candidatus ainarchaeum sp.]
MRIRQIDAFRGLAIVLMVFFTLYALLSGGPDFLMHNKQDSLHAGDFVLPLFIFASGMSLFFFAQKRKGSPKNYALDSIGRFGKLVLISFFLMLLAGAAPFTMDEVMLIALLSLPTLLIAVLPELFIYAGILLPPALYLALLSADALPDFSAAYLGGYPAAVFYLPVMLFGFLAGKSIYEKKGLLPIFAATLFLSVALLFLVPPYKMGASPSFMALASLLSIMLYICVGRAIRIRSLSALSPFFFEYLGRRPIRYWALMFVFFVIPVRFYLFANQMPAPVGLGPVQAASVSMAFLLFLFLVSKLTDGFVGFIETASEKN